MKKLLSVLISLSLLLTCISGVYAKGNDKGKGKGNVKQAQTYTKKQEQKRTPAVNFAATQKSLQDLFKQYHKDLDKRKKILQDMAKLKKQLNKGSVMAVFINGDELNLDTPPVVKYKTMMVPIGPIVKALGAKLNWDKQTNTLTITKDNLNIVIKLNSYVVTVNGKEVKLDAPALSLSNRVYVPVSLIKEILKQEVDIDKGSNAIIIEKDHEVVVNDSVTGTGNYQFEYAGSWSYGAQAGAYMKDNHWTSVTDNVYAQNTYFQVKFDGMQIKLYGAKDPKHGIAAVSIDGGAETNVDYYAPRRKDNVLLYTSPVLTRGQHTLKIRATGLKNSSSSNTIVTVDRVDIAVSGVNTPVVTPTPTSTPTVTVAVTPSPTPTATPVSAATVVNDSLTGTDNNQFAYSGTWAYNTQSGAFQNDIHTSNITGATSQIKFNGKQIALYGTKDPNSGIAIVSVDGVLETVVDCYAATRADNVLLYTSPILANGPHTMTVRVTGSKNAASNNYFITVDSANIFADVPSVNLALNKPAIASSSDDSSRGAAKAFDGNTNTCWYSQYSDNQWVYVDLGAPQVFKSVKLNWENAYGKAYKIQLSNDGINWSDIYTATNGDGGIDEITFAPISARFVKMDGISRATQWGYALKEFEVYN